MTEFEPTDSSTGRLGFLARAIVASQATIGAAVAFGFGATTLSPNFLRFQDTWLRAAVWAILAALACLIVLLPANIRIPARIGYPFWQRGKMRGE